MTAHKQLLPEAQQDKLKNLLVSGDFMLLKEVIASELATAQVDLLEAEIYKEETDAAKAQAKNLRFHAQRYTHTLEVLNELSRESHSLYTVTLTPN